MGCRPDNRLVDAPMVPVACKRCGAQVLARKSSWAQTSVQWDAAAVSQCRQRQDAQQRPPSAEGLFLGCSDLRDSILGAAAEGRVPIVDENRPS
jgi:hypothetical protein